MDKSVKLEKSYLKEKKMLCYLNKHIQKFYIRSNYPVSFLEIKRFYKKDTDYSIEFQDYMENLKQEKSEYTYKIDLKVVIFISSIETSNYYDDQHINIDLDEYDLKENTYEYKDDVANVPLKEILQMKDIYDILPKLRITGITFFSAKEVDEDYIVLYVPKKFRFAKDTYNIKKIENSNVYLVTPNIDYDESIIEPAFKIFMENYDILGNQLEIYDRKNRERHFQTYRYDIDIKLI